jgi:hypothetical protein
VETLRQHVLQQAANELQRRQGHGFPAVMVGVLVAETDLAILDREHAAIGQDAPVDIPAQGAEYLFGPLQGWFTVDDPPFGPNRLGQRQIGSFLTHQIEKQSAKELREGLHRHEVSLAGRSPLGPVGGNPARWHQAMDVRMVDQSPGPGVQDTQDPDQAPYIMGVRGERDERLCRGSEQDVVQVSLVGARKRPQLLGQGQDDMKVGGRQEFLPPLCQPSFGVQAMTLGATAVAAGVVDVVFLTPVIARPQVPA